MTWKPSYLTREQMEERRLAGGRLLKAGKLSQAEIARQWSVSRASVSAWAKQVSEEGIKGLRKRNAKGSTSKLTPEQRQTLKRLLDRGALTCGFSTDRWTLERVHKLIKREFNVAYHPNYLNRLLRKLGFSLQKPVPRAREQERELVKAWLEHDLPRIKKVAAAQSRNRVLG